MGRRQPYSHGLQQVYIEWPPELYPSNLYPGEEYISPSPAYLTGEESGGLVRVILSPVDKPHLNWARWVLKEQVLLPEEVGL